MRFLWCAYALFILYAALLPFHFAGSEAALERLHALPLSVSQSPLGGHLSRPDMLQNLILYLPLGVLGMLVLGERRALLVRVVLTTAVSAMHSVTVESLQLFTTDRVASLNDVATNTSGALIGALVTPVVLLGGRRALAWFGRAGLLVPALYPVLLGFIVLCIAAWHPFDPTLDVGSVWSRAKAFMADPWQAGVLGDEGADAVRYGLFAGAMVLWLRQVQMRRAWPVAALLASLMVCALESSQIILDSRIPGLKDATIGVASAWLGAWLASVSTGWPVQARSALVIVLAWLAAAIVILAPFDIALARRPFDWTPFLNYYQRTSGQTVSHAIELLLAFFPIGFALAAAMGDRVRWVWVAVGSFVLAVPLEYLQGWIVGRYDDVTDPLVLVLGALAGAWMAVPGGAAFNAANFR